MDPESSTAHQKSTGRSDQSPGRKSSKVEVGPPGGRSAYHPGQLHPQGSLGGDIIPSQPCFSAPLPLPTERTHQQAPAPDLLKHTSAYSYEQAHHTSPQLLHQPMASAFMAPVKPDVGLEGRSWHLFDPRGPVGSGSYLPSGLHTHRHLLPSHSPIMHKEEPQPVQSAHSHHTAQVSLKQEEVPRKEKKPQKPGKYICQFCSRPCAKPSVLQKHIRSHTGERPYPCHSCGFSFKTKSNLYKHRKSHAHKLKAGLVPSAKGETFPGTSGPEMEKLSGDEPEEHTEGDESTDSEDETAGMMSHPLELPSKHKHIPTCGSSGTHESSPRQPVFTLAQPSETPSLDEGLQLSESSLDLSFSHKPEDSHTIKQKLALRLSERRKALADEQSQTFLSPGSKGSTESGYFSRSESAEQQLSPPQASAKSYAEIILGKYGRYGQRTAMIATSTTQRMQQVEEKPAGLSFSVPKAQMEQNVIEHITKLITINEAVVDTSQIDSVKPRRTSLSRRGSIESPKLSTSRDSFQFDLKSLGSASLSLDASRLAFSAVHHGHSASETVPLTRSNSMPSASSSCAPPAFKGSHSFDDRMTEPDQAFSHGLITHHRMLKRQKAIELPSGMEYQTEEAGYSAKEMQIAPGRASEEQEPTETDLTKKTKKGPRAKGLMYECDICGARYRKRSNYETHKKYYCSELHAPRARPYLPPTPQEVERRPLGHDIQPQIVHYKLRPSLELTPARKRRKEKSLGDDEEPPGDYVSRPSAVSIAGPCSSTPAQSPLLPPSQSSGLPLEMSPHLGKGEAQLVIEGSSEQRARSRATSTEVKPHPVSGPSPDASVKRTTGKEISVIQHTNKLSRPGSFEKSEALEHLGPQEGPSAEYSTQAGEAEAIRAWQPTAEPTRPHHPPLQARLVRQRKIQVPEILVTEEPDKVEEKEKEPCAKEPEKPAEEFQWPQRSQTLSQLPAEKLPPKKKRLRLAEMSQSSGESSFESATLSRSPSQESSVSLGSGRSASFDREEAAAAATAPKEGSGMTIEVHSRPAALHMLTVPTHYQQPREMRRSSSEQAPGHQLPSEVAETRSKSFDYGSLSSELAPATKLSSPLRERRRCLLVRQATLSCCAEPTPDPQLGPRPEKQEAPLPQPVGAPGPPSCFHSPPPPPSALQPYPSQSSDAPPPAETFQLFQLPLAAEQKPGPPPSFRGQMSALHSVPDVLPGPLPFPLYPLHHLPPLPADLSARPSSLLPPPALPLLPTRSQMLFQLQAGPGAGNFREHKPPSRLSPPICLPPFQSQPEYSTAISTASPSAAQPSITESPEPLRPTVSFTVPVRVQTHMPTFGSAMYTTLSQMLVTQSAESPATVVICRVEDSRPKTTLVCSAAVHGIGLDLAQVIAGRHQDLFQSPYLRVPLPMPFAPMTEGTCAPESYPSTIGGSKRMLSPAGSLELTMETQQQKRVKEEEIEEESEEKTEERADNVARRQSHQPARCCPAKSKAVSVQTSPSLQLPRASEKHELWSGNQYRGKTPLGPVKKEDSQEVAQEWSPLHLQELQTLTSSTLPNPPSVTSPTKPSRVVITDVSDVQHVLHFPSLHVTTSVSWCYLKYTKPNPTQQTDRRSSVYASWCISLYNPNVPGVSTKLSLALLRSKQMSSKEVYTMATGPQRQTGKLVPSSTRKLRVSEIHIPSLLSGDGGKEAFKVEKEEERRENREDDGSTPKKLEPTRIKIFDGGYKSNEDYVYVRGRGRGKYVCEECGIRCKKPSMLKKHIRTHTDLRPYACNYCNFAFKTKGNLTKHMKSKAHSKKCQEMGVTVALMEDVESEEGTSEEPVKRAEESEGTDLAEEHQFSDIEESDDDDDNEDDDEEEEEEEPYMKSLDTASTIPQMAGCSRAETTFSPLETTAMQGSSLTSHYSLSYSASSSQLQAAQLTKSSESPMVPACHSESHKQEGSTSNPLLPLTEQFSSGQGDPLMKRQSILGTTVSSSIDTSPRKPWSPNRDALLSRSGGNIPSGKHSSPEREATLEEHSSSRKEMSPQRHFSPGRELSPRRCLSPGRGISPRRNLSPGREVSPKKCLSPGRVSPRLHLSPEREISPRRTLSSRYLSPARDVSPNRQLSPLSKESPLGHVSPVKDEPPSRCLTPIWQSSQGSAFLAQHSSSPSLGLPQQKSSKEQEKSELKMMSRMGYRSFCEEPSTSSQALHFCFSRNTQTPLDGQSYCGLTGSTHDYVFSHLPLHSQQLVRTPYPMIPIGGIQMVQARPGYHSGLVPSQVSLQSGFPVSLSAPKPLSTSKSEATVYLEEASKSSEATSSESLPLQLSSAPMAPLIMTSSLTRSGKQSVTLQRTEIAELEEAAECRQAEYRVPIYSEPSTIAALSRSGKEAGSVRLDSPSTSHEHSPKPSTCGGGTSKDLSKKQFGCSDTYYESACTLTTMHPLQGSSGSSSAESLSPSHSFQTGADRTTSSGQCPPVRMQMGSRSESKGEDFKHLDTQKDNETGSS
ncbi:transcription factor HIVEP3 [Hypanus sabinus]|uniref:transcription factor HIVEP3 n=1 Tax=Hypanus sabinus TaxID=79690 RepID=UPI0028C44FC7|nr:transcription factor HIVEP3 [Hypanus sabinus]XP_059810781.1 transcription factor HIVEP3 [Hypanus sabinus]XP_059810782.1 transcription factor HIVEP3 [Hypanus sabinus]XP_059810783.1 transcription factor HIVEP3 [Hypanus sabinus]XP_059810784.1 transcription factor HIVEP3 [Hypanus sabinus]XP_059810785.1 transcription factor HIVEP3 [Hypanus sabinus]XP_059810786.1 transcription factor HIVEP3 [Hypanus sabinus]XP_059810787.1 transcription factor HIVEP3 [Hypanus sabinus]XP_059810788.1 transcriptio